jgi:stage II sporulation protein D
MVILLTLFNWLVRFIMKLSTSGGKKTSIFLLFLVTCFPAYSQLLHISLFNELPVKSIVISSLKGTYHIFGDSALIMDQSQDDAMYISIFNDRLLLRNSKAPIGNFVNIRFEAIDTDAVIRLSPVNPKADARQYNDNLSVSIAFGRILLINEVQPDFYIAGVVDAEAGPNAGTEFYKAQSILVRTYLYTNLNRHQSEGFQLCDGVHCQAYRGRAVRNPIIVEATRATRDCVLVARDSSFINAVFHANCGGETESGANAWLNDKSYLVPVKDPFCANSSSAKWTKLILLDQWKTYLKSHGFKFSADVVPNTFDFSQINRKQYYRIGRDSIPLKQIRTDFQLKSTFFSVAASAKDVTLNGRGFGHGVGLCQDGAMHMAKIGYSCEDILKYYFKGIRIVRYSDYNRVKQ